MEKQSGQSSLGVEREYRMESGIQRDKNLIQRSAYLVQV